MGAIKTDDSAEELPRRLRETDSRRNREEYNEDTKRKKLCITQHKK